jgi:hypothetical protein
MATPTLSPATMSATRRSMSCSEVPGPSRPGVSSRLYVERLRRRRRKQHRTASGWKTRLGSTPPIAPRAWPTPGSSRCWSPRPSPTLQNHFDTEVPHSYPVGHGLRGQVREIVPRATDQGASPRCEEKSSATSPRH